MQSSRNIAVIAHDRGLLDSLVFSLEVAGFGVEGSAELPAAGLDAARLACVVLDAASYRREPALRAALALFDAPLVYLADDLPPEPMHPRMTRLQKPFQGPELLSVVEMYAAQEPAFAQEPARG